MLVGGLEVEPDLPTRAQLAVHSRSLNEKKFFAHSRCLFPLKADHSIGFVELIIDGKALGRKDLFHLVNKPAESWDNARSLV